MSLGSRIKQCRGGRSQAEYAKDIGVSPRTVGNYETDTRLPDAKTIRHICADAKVTSDWLLFEKADEVPALKADRDDLLGQLIEKAWDPERDFVVQALGLVESSLDGWQAIKRTPMWVAAPVDIHRAGGFGVVAIGDSMLPAGVEPGFLLYCDPTIPPKRGDLVYLEDLEGNATIRVFQRITDQGGEEVYQLKGWLDPDGDLPNEPQKPFTFETPKSKIARLAVVVYVKRRV